MYCWILLIFFFAVQVSLCIDFCPATNTIDLNNTGNFIYPVEIYAPHDVYLKVMERNETTLCYDNHISTKNPLHCSTTERFCPVTLENVHDATRRKFHKASSLCHLKPKLASKHENIRVIVFGGSIPGGSRSNGCNAADGHGEINMYRRCSWPNHFGNWLKRTSAANVTLLNLAESGYDAETRVIMFQDVKEKFGVDTFTNNDLIILDHSVNDHDSRIALIEKGMENLILTIYAHSEPNSWPSIVLIDDHVALFKGPKDIVYPIAYEQLARHYNLSLWSYRDMVYSNYSATYQSQYVEYLKWNHNPYGDLHPPWHVQLFMADLFGAIFETEMQHCTEPIMSLTTKLHSSPLILPPYLFLTLIHNECAARHPSLFVMSYSDVIQHRPISGTYYSIPDNSWQVREDRKDRGGIICELNNDSYYLPGQKSAQFIVKLNQTSQSLKDDGHRELYIQLLYLSTYENAGMVEVTLCGTLRCDLDALWNNFRTNRISIPQVYENKFVLNDCIANNYTYPTIVVTHRNLSDDHSLLNRGNQKFKIISLRICGVESVE